MTEAEAITQSHEQGEDDTPAYQLYDALHSELRKAEGWTNGGYELDQAQRGALKQMLHDITVMNLGIFAELHG